MAKLSINELTTQRWTFEEDVVRYAAAGISGIGVWRTKLTDAVADHGLEHAVDLLAEHQLAVSNLLWVGGYTGSEGHSYVDAVRDTREGIELAAALRAECLVVFSGGRAGHTHRHARRIVVDALKALEPFAAEHGVALALEPMHQQCAEPGTFLVDLDETLAILDRVASPYVKLVFDTYHLGHDRKLLDQIADIVPRIAVVHLADGRRWPPREQNRCRLGEGVVPLGDIYQRLHAAGYDGHYDVELSGEDVETYDYADLIRHSHRAFDRLRNGAKSRP